MIVQRFAKGLREQDWATVLIEVLVVVLGVYVGIFIGEAQDERETQAEVKRSLIVVLDQLRADLGQLDEVVVAQTENVAEYSLIIDHLAQDTIDRELLEDQMLGMGNRTFFSNRSAYQSMRSSGYLAELEDRELGLLMSSLFEAVYERHSVNAGYIDQNVNHMRVNVREAYWDRLNDEFVGDPYRAKTMLRNSHLGVRGYAQVYRGLLTRLVRPKMVETITALEDYLDLPRSQPIAEGAANE